jgi:hypothetical protein
MNRIYRSRLWRDIDSYNVVTIGRTPWTIGGNYWMVRSRVLGDNWPDRKDQPERRFVRLSGRDSGELVARYTRDARRGRLANGILADREWDDERTLVAVAHVGLHAERSTVRVPLNQSWAAGLDRLVAEHTDGRFELRVDPWRNVVSWWTLGANSYPLALLLGIHDVALTFPEAS